MDTQARGHESDDLIGHKSDEVLVDTAISHLEKLRRVLMLEEWIADAANDPLLAGSCREWRAERAKLIEQLELEPVAEFG